MATPNPWDDTWTADQAEAGIGDYLSRSNAELAAWDAEQKRRFAASRAQDQGMSTWPQDQLGLGDYGSQAPYQTPEPQPATVPGQQGFSGLSGYGVEQPPAPAAPEEQPAPTTPQAQPTTPSLTPGFDAAASLWFSNPTGAQAQSGETPPSEMGDLQAGWETGMRSLKGLYSGAAGAAGQAIGYEPLRQWGVERMQQFEKEQQPFMEGRPTRLEDIKDIGSAVDWAQFSLGQVAPSVVESIGAAVVGSLIGSAIPGAGTAAGAVGGAIAKGYTKKLLGEYIASGLAKGATREVAEAAAKKALARQAGAAIGLFGSSYAMGVGDIYGETLDEKGKGDLVSSFVGAVPYAALDALVPISIFGKIARGTPGEKALSRYAREMFVNAAMEGATESGQEALLMIAGARNGKEYTPEEVISRLGNSFAAAAIAGGVGGAAAAVRKGPTEEQRDSAILRDMAAVAVAGRERLPMMDAQTAISALEGQDVPMPLRARAVGAVEAALRTEHPDLADLWHGMAAKRFLNAQPITSSQQTAETPSGPAAQPTAPAAEPAAAAPEVGGAAPAAAGAAAETPVRVPGSGVGGTETPPAAGAQGAGPQAASGNAGRQPGGRAEGGVTPKTINLTGTGEAISANLYDGLFGALQQGKDTFAGVKDPVLAKAKPYYDQGIIRSAEDLKEFVVNNYAPTQPLIDRARTKQQPEATNAQEVRSDQGQVHGAGRQEGPMPVQGGGNLQQPAQAGTEAGGAGVSQEGRQGAVTNAPVAQQPAQPAPTPAAPAGATTAPVEPAAQPAGAGGRQGGGAQSVPTPNAPPAAPGVAGETPRRRRRRSARAAAGYGTAETAEVKQNNDHKKRTEAVSWVYEVSRSVFDEQEKKWINPSREKIKNAVEEARKTGVEVTTSTGSKLAPTAFTYFLKPGDGYVYQLTISESGRSDWFQRKLKTPDVTPPAAPGVAGETPRRRRRRSSRAAAGYAKKQAAYEPRSLISEAGIKRLEQAPEPPAKEERPRITRKQQSVSISLKDKKGKWRKVEVQGRVVTFPGFKDFTFVLHRAIGVDDKPDGPWTVTEATTGFAVSGRAQPEATSRAIVQYTNKLLQKAGLEKVRENINRALEKTNAETMQEEGQPPAEPETAEVTPTGARPISKTGYVTNEMVAWANTQIPDTWEIRLEPAPNRTGKKEALNAYRDGAYDRELSGFNPTESGLDEIIRLINRRAKTDSETATTPAPQAGTQAGAGAAEGGAATAAQTETTPQGQLEKGARVVITSGPFEGRHGEIADVSFMQMRPIFGGGKTETSVQYTVRTDAGAISYSGENAVRAETEQAPSVVPDIADGDMMVPPREFLAKIGVANQAIRNATVKRGRARKESMKRQWAREEEVQRARLDKLKRTWDEWVAKYPEEAAKARPAPEQQATTQQAGAAIDEELLSEGKELPVDDALIAAATAMDWEGGGQAMRFSLGEQEPTADARAYYESGEFFMANPELRTQFERMAPPGEQDMGDLVDVQVDVEGGATSTVRMPLSEALQAYDSQIESLDAALNCLGRG